MTNIFELFGLKESFHPNAAEVKKKFYELSRQFHPDRFVQGGATAMGEALKMSAIINKAYQTLNNKDAVMSYILQYHGVLEADEKFNLPPDFLMEMMELNEAVSEAEISDEAALKQEATKSLEAHLQLLETELLPLTQAFDAGNDEQGNLLAIKEFYFRKKYLLRIQERIAKFALP